MSVVRREALYGGGEERADGRMPRSLGPAAREVSEQASGRRPGPPRSPEGRAPGPLPPQSGEANTESPASQTPHQDNYEEVPALTALLRGDARSADRMKQSAPFEPRCEHTPL